MPQRLEGLERLAVLILRLFLGFAFIMHGSQKLLGAFGGPGIAGVGGMLTKLGLEPVGPEPSMLGGCLEAGPHRKVLFCSGSDGPQSSSARAVPWRRRRQSR